MPAALADLEDVIDYLCEARSVRPSYGSERRSDERHPLTVVVDFVPLDSRQQPCGKPAKAITRDLSCDGLGLFTEARVDAPFLRVKLPACDHRRLELLVEVVRCERMDFMFDLGARIVECEWSDHPRTPDRGEMLVPLEP